MAVVIQQWCIDLWGLRVCTPVFPFYEPDNTNDVRIGKTLVLNDWLSEQITNGILAIAGGINELKERLADARGQLIQGMVDAIKDPKSGGFALLGIFVTTLVLSIAMEAVKGIAVVKAALAVIEGISKTVASIGRFLHLDLIITLARLGGLFNEQWANALGELYTSLGAISLELETDFSYINVFAEVNRSMLFTAYSLTDNAWLRAQADYAEGITDFLGGIEGKLGEYVAHPEKVFVDLQKAISDGKTDESEKQSSRIWAAIDKASQWIENAGNMLLDEVDHIKETIAELPAELRDAIMAHVQPYMDKLDWFEQNQWLPFFDEYHQAKAIINDYFEANNLIISDIQKNINDPFGIIDNLFLLDPGSAKEAADNLWSFITKPQHEDINRGADLMEEMAITIAATESPPLPEIAAAPSVPPAIVRPAPPKVVEPLPEATWFVGEGTGFVFPPGSFPSDGTTWYFGG